MIIIFNLFLVRAMLRGLFLNFVPMTARSSFTFVIKVSVITARCVRCVDVECSLHEIVYFSSLFSQFTDVAGFISNEYTRKTHSLLILLNPWFSSKCCKFPLCLFLDKMNFEIVFDDYPVRKQALLNYNIEFTELQNYIFPKGLTHDFGQKLEFSSACF